MIIKSACLWLEDDIRFNSEYERHHPIRHRLAVALPVGPVLAGAPNIVSEAAVEQQDGEEEDVEVGQGPGETGGGRPKKGRQDLGGVVEVACQAPPACGKMPQDLG